MSGYTAISFARFDRLIHRYGKAAEVIKTPKASSQTPWQIAPANTKEKPIEARVLLQQVRHVNRRQTGAQASSYAITQALISVCLSSDSLAFSRLVMGHRHWQIARPELLTKSGDVHIFRIELVAQEER